MQYRYSKTDEAFDHKKSWLHSSLNKSKSSSIFGLIINILETFKRTRHNLLPFLQFSEKVHFNAFDEGYINSVCPLEFFAFVAEIHDCCKDVSFK